jgi:quercetin dioxygenase-like cupin family protein
MKIFSYESIPADNEAEGAKGVHVRWLITEKIGAPNFAMRLFEIDPQGFSPLHYHPWEHEVYMLEGEGTITSEEGEHPLRKGDVVFIASNERHQITNTGNTILKFLCMVPNIRQESE